MYPGSGYHIRHIRSMKGRQTARVRLRRQPVEMLTDPSTETQTDRQNEKRNGRKVICTSVDREIGKQTGRQEGLFFCLLVGCLTSQQTCLLCISDNCTCCHTEIEVADQTFHLTQSQYTDTRPTSPSTDPITPGAWQGSHWTANF